MSYFWELVKKEYIEIRYSYKQLLMYAFLFVFFIWAVTSIESAGGGTGLIPIEWSNIYYAITIFICSLMPSNFLMGSILSDKRNQTFERYFVSGNIKTIMVAKLSAMSMLGIIPFIIFYVYFIIKGINIIDNIFIVINTPLYFWIGLCVITIIDFIFNDETAIAFAGMPCLILIMALLYLNDYIAVNYHPVLTCIITTACAVITTVIAYNVYKKTKYFLKI